MNKHLLATLLSLSLVSCIGANEADTLQALRDAHKQELKTALKTAPAARWRVHGKWMVASALIFAYKESLQEAYNNAVISSGIEGLPLFDLKKEISPEEHARALYSALSDKVGEQIAGFEAGALRRLEKVDNAVAKSLEGLKATQQVPLKQEVAGQTSLPEAPLTEEATKEPDFISRAWKNTSHRAGNIKDTVLGNKKQPQNNAPEQSPVEPPVVIHLDPDDAGAGAPV